MSEELENLNNSIFEQIKEVDDHGNEFGGARKQSKVLEYTDFRNFLSVVDRARQACEKSGQLVENHLVDFNEMVPIGSGAERSMPSVKLSRYACYSHFAKCQLSLSNCLQVPAVYFETCKENNTHIQQLNCVLFAALFAINPN